MNLILKRARKFGGFTEGELFKLEENVPVKICDTLEPTWRDLRAGEHKVYGKTAIPEGNYPVDFYPSDKFGRLMPVVKYVPNFGGIMIHPGNSVEDTAGCILVGENTDAGQLSNSREAFTKVLKVLVSETVPNEKIYLLVI